MSSKHLIQRRLRQSKLSFKQLSVDLNDNDCGKETDSSDFDNVDLVCKFCDPCVSGRCSFPLSEQLIAHCRESHPTACLGCLEMFGSSSDLLEHLEAFPHEPPVCRDFYRSFGSVVAKVKEECMTGFSPSKSSFLSENPNGKCPDSMEAGFHEEVNVKNGVKNVSCQFLCEFCTFDGCMNRKFKSRNGLFIHCLKCHPNGCLGCFELFDDSEVLLQHLEAFPHEPPVCRACCRSFGSIEAKSKHKCVASSRSSSKSSKAKTFYSAQPQLSCESQSKRKRTSNHPKEVLVDDSLKLNANEADSNENCVLEEMSTSGEDYDSDESLYAPSELSSRDAVSGSKNAAVNCLHCSFVSRGSRSLPSIHVIRNHTCAHHPNVCLVCFESFDNSASLAEHIKLLGHNMLCCKPCGKAFPSKMAYYQHERKEHEDHFPIRCSQCSFGTFKKAAMRSHMRRMHFCKNSEVADDDAEKEPEEQLPKGICPLCDFRCMSEFAVLMHMYDKHPERNQVPKYKCEECQLAFGRPYSYAAHLRNKHWGEPRFRLMYYEFKKGFITTFECEPCRLTFSPNDFYGFRRHLFMGHRSSTPYECTNCCLGFWDLFDLKEHNHKCHDNSSPYMCEECNLSFVDLDRLVLHLYQVHQRETLPYAYCCSHKVVLHGRRHYTKHMYIQHYLKTKTMEFPCEQCGKVLSNKKRLREHMNMHLPDRPFKVILPIPLLLRCLFMYNALCLFCNCIVNSMKKQKHYSHLSFFFSVINVAKNSPTKLT